MATRAERIKMMEDSLKKNKGKMSAKDVATAQSIIERNKTEAKKDAAKPQTIKKAAQAAKKVEKNMGSPNAGRKQAKPVMGGLGKTAAKLKKRKN